MKSKKIVIALLLMMVLAVIVSACQPSVGEAKQEFCEKLNKVNSAAEQLKSVDANTSIEDARKAKEDLTKAWKELSDAKEQLEGVQMDASEEAYNLMVKDVENSVTGGMTLSDASQTIVSSAEKLSAELKVINTTICGVK